MSLVYDWDDEQVVMMGDEQVDRLVYELVACWVALKATSLVAWKVVLKVLGAAAEMGSTTEIYSVDWSARTEGI